MCFKEQYSENRQVGTKKTPLNGSIRPWPLLIHPPRLEMKLGLHPRFSRFFERGNVYGLCPVVFPLPKHNSKRICKTLFQRKCVRVVPLNPRTLICNACMQCAGFFFRPRAQTPRSAVLEAAGHAQLRIRARRRKTCTASNSRPGAKDSPTKSKACKAVELAREGEEACKATELHPLNSRARATN